MSPGPSFEHDQSSLRAEQLFRSRNDAKLFEPLSSHSKGADIRLIGRKRILPSYYDRFPDASALPVAADWTEAALLGNVATGLAVLAVAGLGLLALQGHLPVGRAVRVILGCCILFSAGTVAAGLMGLAQSSRRPAQAVVIPSPALVPSLPIAPPPNPDPYAGASVPM